MSIPILTIPEGAYDISAYTSSPLQYNKRKSRLLTYLIKLTHGSAITLTIVYIIGLFVLKPLLETKAQRHYEFLEFFRGKLRDCYLNLVGRVSYIPIVAINKNDGSGKLYADAITQTDDSYLKQVKGVEVNDNDNNDKLGQNGLISKFRKLSNILNDCTSFQVNEMPHYKSTNYAVKDLQNKTDLVYFNSNELFSVNVPTNVAPSKSTSNSTKAKTTTNDTSTNQPTRKKNLSTEIKHEIRSMKGLYMSGQV